MKNTWTASRYLVYRALSQSIAEDAVRTNSILVWKIKKFKLAEFFWGWLKVQYQLFWFLCPDDILLWSRHKTLKSGKHDPKNNFRRKGYMHCHAFHLAWEKMCLRNTKILKRYVKGQVIDYLFLFKSIIHEKPSNCALGC